MQKLVRKELVNRLDYDTTGNIGICKVCIGGKITTNSTCKGVCLSLSGDMTTDNTGAMKREREGH